MGRQVAEKGENMVVHLSLIVLSTGFIEQHRHHEKNSSLLMECHLSSVVSQVSSARGQKRLKEVDDEQICHFIILKNFTLQKRCSHRVPIEFQNET